MKTQSEKFMEFLKDSKRVEKIRKNYLSYAKKNNIGASHIIGDADDIFQDTILSCISTFDKGNSEDKNIDFEKYLYAALKYKSFNALAKVKTGKRNKKNIVFVEDICDHYKPDLNYDSFFENDGIKIEDVHGGKEMFDNQKIKMINEYVKENLSSAEYNMFMFWSKSKKTLKDMAKYSGYSQTKIMNDLRAINLKIKQNLGGIYENNY